MNETIQTILTRRSIRRFKPDLLTKEQLDIILEAGLYAPSTKGKQTRHFLVINGQENIDKVTGLVREAHALAAEPRQKRYAEKLANPKYTINYGAPVFIIMTADRDWEANSDADCAVALENMFLAAHSLGIGSVWINQLTEISDVPVFREFLTKHGVPFSYIVRGCAAFGFNAGEHPKAAPRKENCVTIVDKL